MSAEEDLRALKQRLEDAIPSTAQAGEIHVVPINIVPKKGGSGRMYALSTGGFSVYPEPEAITTVHKACGERFDHERLDDMTTLGVAALDWEGSLLAFELHDADEVENR